MNFRRTVVLVATGVNALIVVLWYALFVADSGTVSPLVISLLVALLVAAGIITHVVQRNVLRRKLYDPLQEIQKTTQAIAEGASSGRVAVSDFSEVEVREVATAINRLARKATNDIDEMRRLERVRSEFVGNVSHELRTPIFSVQGYLETLLDGAIDEPEVAREFLEKALVNALRLNALLSDLIEISKIESGQLRFSFRYFDIVSLINEIVATMEIRGEKRGIRLLIDAPKEDALTVYGDKERITQVLANLIDNAVKYNRDNGTVTISATQTNGQVEISIADTGIGIPESDVARVFERFFRVDKARSRAVGGTGLGLSIVKHILEAHDTQARVTSEQGVGTTFSFKLKSA